MGIYTDYTRDWLDRRYRRAAESGVYFAHMPIYGFGSAHSEPGHLPRLARTFQILKTLSEIPFRTLLDVGAGEGFLAIHAARIFGAEVVAADLSVEACRVGHQLYGVETVAVDSSRLPFRDHAFDVVVCSEVTEHVEWPLETLLELHRVARRALVWTTEELLTDREEIARRLFVRSGLPHGERNIFHPDDVRALFGGGVDLRTQFTNLPESPDPFINNPDALRDALIRSTPRNAPGEGGVGVVAVIPSLQKEVATDPTQQLSARECASQQLRPEEILESLLTFTLPERPAPPRARGPHGALLAAALKPEYQHCPRRDGVPVLYHSAESGEAAADSPIRDPQRAGLENRLREILPGDAARREHILQLRDRLELPGRPALRNGAPSDRIELTNPESWRGWTRNAQWEEQAGGEFRFRSTGSDPWMLSPCFLAPIERIDLELYIYNPAFSRDAGTGQIFWMCCNDDTFTEKQSVTFPVTNDGKLHNYCISIPETEAVLCLRVDPVNGPCEFDIRSITIHRRR